MIKMLSTKSKPIAVFGSVALLSACLPIPGQDYIPELEDWPPLESKIKPRPYIEEKVAELVATMTLEEKIGQMVQGEIASVTAQDVIDYHLGSVLNGGGSWPNNDKQASVQDWLDLADGYWDASMNTDDGRAAIPLIWGTDAVHGHSNVFGATVFPHNIGLGAANDPGMVKHIGELTARQVAATGIDWTFAPTLAVVRDDRWGRTYEGYSEDGEIVFHYGRAMVEGLQGSFGESSVIATAKHFIGDGGTDLGDDQGDTLATEADLRNIHGQGYFSSITAGVQTVMASFNSWQGEKLHGHAYLMDEVLKVKMGFDGFVVSDWNGIGQVEGCTNDHCPQAINAGIDMIMVPHDWKAFITNTIADVEAGAIPMDRIDDAVTRILRVKYRAGLFFKPKPSERKHGGNEADLSSPFLKKVARSAVRKSLVLLKDNPGVMPILGNKNVLVAGKSAHSIQNQTGVWTLTWQGTGNTNEDFPNGESIYQGIAAKLTAGGGTAVLSEDGSAADDSYDVIIAVIGETPYAEGQGDLNKFATLELSKRHPEDLALLNNLRAAAPNTPILTVLVTGRPLWVNKELNASDAFVVAWLPGTEGGGVADVLFGQRHFKGKFPFSWPAEDCQVPVNKGDELTPLFPYGFGLTTDDDTYLGPLPEEVSDRGCAAPDIGDSGTTNQPLDVFLNGSNQGDWVLRIGGPSNWNGTDVDMDPASTTTLPGSEVTTTTEDGLIQHSAK